ncbi:MAG: bifunctional riboflavin kinase/FAD synthetase [bacterium]
MGIMPYLRDTDTLGNHPGSAGILYRAHGAGNVRDHGMIIIRGLHNYRPVAEKICLSMGNFDGLHLGHRKVIRTTMDRAAAIGGKGMLLTFNPHPRWVLNPDTPTRLLTTLHERVALLARWNLDILLLVRFDNRLATLDPERFVKEILVDTLGISEIVLGSGFTFGRNRTGTLSLLEEMGRTYGFQVIRMDLTTVDGTVISSSLIRDCIQKGEIEAANRLLGYEYCITGKVARGCGRGWRMGYPTANLKVISKVVPPRGVYLVKVEKGEGVWHGLANLGFKPTFGSEGDMGIEVYILDLHEDLYGQRLRVRFQRRIRDEIAFSSPQDLIKQIEDDVTTVHQWLSGQTR